ncbi:MAG: MBL fold metallo-hydrolase [Sphaerochaetaceae bacterium]|nr:MBL fold metallo-hydrolase [Sphaerochaetaceae bacterium]
MKRILFALSLILLLCLVSCASAKVESSKGSVTVAEGLDPKVASLLSNYKAIDEFDNKRLSSTGVVTTAYLQNAPLVPWNENAREVAKQTGTMRYYFFTASGLPSSGKWGDSCLIVFPNGQTMLIDAGVSGFGEHLMRNLAALGVDYIDYLMFSHNHDDHSFGVLYTDFLSYFKVGQCFWSGCYSTSWSNPDKIAELMAEKGIPCSILSQGDEFWIGDVQARVLEPVKEEMVGKGFTGDENVNATSIVIRFDYKDVSSLFTGDLYQFREEDIIKDLTAKGMVDLLDVDILKTPHHGGTTSSTKNLVNAVTPYIAVATGSYPMEISTYTRYAKVGSYCLMDTLDGYIRIVTDGSDIDFETSRVRQTTMFDNLDSVAQQIRDKNAAK